MQRVVIVCLGLLLAGCGREKPAKTDADPDSAERSGSGKTERKPTKADIPELIKQLTAPDFEVRRKAAHSLGELGPEAEEAIPALGKMLFEDPDVITRDLVADELKRIGLKASVLVPKLLTTLQGGDTSARQSAASALGRLGLEADKVVPALLQASREGDSIRYFAISALGDFGPGAKAALPELRKALQDWSPDPPVAAATAIWKISRQEKEVVPVLIRALRNRRPPPPPRGGIAQLDGNMLLRWKAARVLADMGTVAKKAVPALLTAAEDRSPQVRVEAALALWKIDRQAEPAVKSLVSVLETTDATVTQFSLASDQAKAADYLGQIGSFARSALPVLQRVRDDPLAPLGVRQAAARAVEKIDSK